ncbi:hypothetical protein G5V59_15650 [Nocardioides sp. W3-2-3]|uniref:hypothetical protein n=1 Tax=Nocardioides convexus TaxID=2712224 RepID=UPI0024187B61|nr:hypothetical protein [Nocardioides convexus]NHA00868.1 hypothetical protein [Nocardioides convexus]
MITQADVDGGSVDNVATAKGEGPKGDPDDPKDDVVSPPDTTTTPVVVAPGLVLDKRVTGVEDVNGNGQTDAGDEIGYAFEPDQHRQRDPARPDRRGLHARGCRDHGDVLTRRPRTGCLGGLHGRRAVRHHRGGRVLGGGRQHRGSRRNRSPWPPQPVQRRHGEGPDLDRGRYGGRPAQHGRPEPCAPGARWRAGRRGRSAPGGRSSPRACRRPPPEGGLT